MAWYPGDALWLHDQVFRCSGSPEHGPGPTPGWLLDLWGYDWSLFGLQMWPSDQKNCPCHHHNNGECFTILEHCARHLEYLVEMIIVFKLGKLLCVYINMLGPVFMWRVSIRLKKKKESSLVPSSLTKNKYFGSAFVCWVNISYGFWKLKKTYS